MKSGAIDEAGRRNAVGERRRVGARFAPLGIALTVEADSEALIDAVSETCRGWEGAAATGGPRLHLELELGAVTPASRPDVQVCGARLSLSGGVEAYADASTGRAWCRAPSASVFDDPLFREQVLDSLILWLVTRNGRTPLHASAFVADGVAILLAGRSGSGKSCLARTADKAGFALLTDDTVYVEAGDRFRLWGTPRPIHVYPEDAPDAGEAPIRLRNGKHKRALQPASLGQLSTADAAVLCVLHRTDRVSLEPIDQDVALKALGPPEAGFDLLAGDIDRVLRRITNQGAWRLSLSADPAEAIRLLAANLPRLVERAVS